MTLDQLSPGGTGRIQSIGGEPSLVQRLAELGLLEGDDVEVIAIAPLGDPIEVRCGSIRLCLRKLDAARVTLAGPA